VGCFKESTLKGKEGVLRDGLYGQGREVECVEVFSMVSLRVKGLKVVREG